MGNDLRHRPDHLTHITFLKVKWRLTVQAIAISRACAAWFRPTQQIRRTEKRSVHPGIGRARHRVRFNHIAQIRLLHLVSLLGRDYADKHAIVSSLCTNG